MSWEYRIANGKMVELVESLNGLGKLNWEVIQFRENSTGGWWALLKRPGV